MDLVLPVIEGESKRSPEIAEKDSSAPAKIAEHVMGVLILPFLGKIEKRDYHPYPCVTCGRPGKSRFFTYSQNIIGQGLVLKQVFSFYVVQCFDEKRYAEDKHSDDTKEINEEIIKQMSGRSLTVKGTKNEKYRMCGWCSHSGPKQLLKRCSQCKSVSYCSVDCQRWAWKEHRADCRAKKKTKKRRRHRRLRKPRNRPREIDTISCDCGNASVIAV